MEELTEVKQLGNRLFAGSGGFFQKADGQGVTAHPNGTEAQAVQFDRVMASVASQGMPQLWRFPQIIATRIDAMASAFRHALAKRSINENGFRITYPLKANSSPVALEQLLGAQHGAPVGLEVGSKAELALALAKSDANVSVIINGVKDGAMLNAAQGAAANGREVCIVISHPNEVDMVTAALKRAESSPPIIGLRLLPDDAVRRKFGLSVAEAFAVVSRLQGANLGHLIRLLHMHGDAPMKDEEDVRKRCSTLAKFAAEMHQIGLSIDYLDIGGGLPSELPVRKSQTGTRVDEMDLQLLATQAVNTIRDEAIGGGVAMPKIIVEAGRWLVAQHAVLITQVLQAEEIGRSPMLNLSVFSSTPDAWGISQKFPVVGLNHPHGAEQGVRFNDITCDPDGSICDVENEGSRHNNPETIQPFKEGDHVCVFMLGAYQDALSSNHNLIGRPTEITITSKNDSFEAAVTRPATTVAEILAAQGHRDLTDEALNLLADSTYPSLP